jgi:hypothetical protein
MGGDSARCSCIAGEACNVTVNSIAEELQDPQAHHSDELASGMRLMVSVHKAQFD